MKKTFARALALLMLAAVMVGCFAGCQTNGSGEYETKPSQDAIVDKPVINEPVTISVLCTRHSGYTTEADQLWYFHYLEWWFEQQGYDVNFDVQQTTEGGTQTSLLLNTNSLPDLVFGINISNTNIVKYGIEDTLLLDWTPYINESLMPNLYARMQADTQMTSQMKAPDNGIYGLPYINPSLTASGCYGTSERFYFRQSWLDAVNKEIPTTKEELLDVLRAFKNVQTPNGKAIPIVSSSGFLEKFLWTCMGFYGTEPAKFGANLMIKDGKLVVPAYTENYREFVTLMNTFYTEGIIAQDYFSYNDASAKALAVADRCGVYCWWTMEALIDDYMDYVSAKPIPLGDVTKVEDIHVSRLSWFSVNQAWASSTTKYPALLAMMMDKMYSDEGAFTYRYGPKKGEDPLGMVEGYYFDEKGNVMTDKVADGTYVGIEIYGRDWLFPSDNVGMRPAVKTSGTGENVPYIDSVTGETYTVFSAQALTDDNIDGHWRLTTINAWSDRATSIRIPKVYQNSEDTATASDIIGACQTLINTETVKFITGQRPLSEVDAFWAELKAMGIETYLELLNTAHGPWLEQTFGAK